MTLDQDALADLCERLNRSEVFRRSVTRAGSFLLILGESVVFLRVGPGRCLEARPGERGEEADFVIEVDGAALEKLARRELDVVAAFSRGELRLKRGSLLGLLPYARAARAVLEALA